ncbi:MAG TPA: hypothetical protein VFD58_27050 [Blastocatellia bacterium]|nr:hypothetical protein [Blastocatellia bacterium]
MKTEEEIRTQLGAWNDEYQQMRNALPLAGTAEEKQGILNRLYRLAVEMDALEWVLSEGKTLFDVMPPDALRVIIPARAGKGGKAKPPAKKAARKKARA